MHRRWISAFVLSLGVLTGMVPAAPAAAPPNPEQMAVGRTPPRLGLVEGQVSFWRPGAPDWVQAQVNIPLAPGDELSTGSPGSLEIQIGSRAFVRAWGNTQLGLVNQEPDFLQVKVTGGHASFDLRTLEPGSTVEVDTPNAAFTIEHAGYYRLDVAGERTSFITRRAGRATLTPASGEAVAITPSEEVVIEGTGSPRVTAYVAPPLDQWDTWNYTRTDRLLEALSGRYVSPGMYGVNDLDPYGTWRVVPSYGPVWVPTAVPPDWVPYSTGAWVIDPVYGWTWVDTAPWGWAPYHYGRWVFVDGFWAWAPGPVVVRVVYAPALVVFFGEPAVSIGIAGPLVGWVALGWGEPLVPWWGPAGFIHVPWWGSWGGPRVVNNVVISNTTVVNVENISVYGNTRVPNAVVVVGASRFGNGSVTGARVTRVDVARLQPIHAAPQVTATAASFVPTPRRGVQPPEGSLKRSVVATRPPSAGEESAAGGTRRVGPAGASPPPRLVSPPEQPAATPIPRRPPFGPGTVERPMAARSQAPSPPRLTPPVPPPAGASRAAPPPAALQAPPPRREPQVTGPVPAAPPPGPRVGGPPVAGPPSGAPPPSGPRAREPQMVRPSPAPPPPARRGEMPQVAAPPAGSPPSAGRAEPPHAPGRPLPGEPANRLSPSRVQRGPQPGAPGD